MSRNGRLFASLVSAEQLIPSVWDPYVYRSNGKVHALAHYAAVQRAGRDAILLRSSRFRPIEYRDIPPRSYLTFDLERLSSEAVPGGHAVGEDEILFGTMRAYLGNALVTPLAEWLTEAPPVHFDIKSEFVVVRPEDRLTYFWLVYLRSPQFLEHLPPGGGGTRPRLTAESLAATPVLVPDVSERREIDREIRQLAKQEWATRADLSHVAAKFDRGGRDD